MALEVLEEVGEALMVDLEKLVVALIEDLVEEEEVY
jgi:hypothetical protein